MKQPVENDFEVTVTGAGVEVIFKPTNSHYSYNRLVDDRDIARFGPISPARVRQRRTHRGYRRLFIGGRGGDGSPLGSRRRWTMNDIVRAAPASVGPM